MIWSPLNSLGPLDPWSPFSPREKCAPLPCTSCWKHKPCWNPDCTCKRFLFNASIFIPDFLYLSPLSPLGPLNHCNLMNPNEKWAPLPCTSCLNKNKTCWNSACTCKRFFNASMFTPDSLCLKSSEPPGSPESLQSHESPFWNAHLCLAHLAGTKPSLAET